MAVMKEIAEYANVSMGSVVRYLRDPQLLKESTRKKIEDAISRLQADPILPNVSVKEKKMMRITLVMNDVNNPFFAHLFTTFQQCAKLRGMEVLLVNPSAEKGRFRLELENLPDRSFDNMIFCFLPEWEPAKEYAKDFKDTMNFVFVGSEMFEDSVSSCLIDYSKGIQQAIDQAIELGHKKICFVGNALHDDNTKYNVFSEYVREQKKAGINIDSTSIDIEGSFGSKVDDKWDWERGVMAAQFFMEQEMDATMIVAKNDLVALGMMREFIKNGKRIPEDISIVGCDNTEIGKIFYPSLSTIDCNINKICEEAISSLEESSISYPSKAIFKKFDTRLIKRESLGQVPNGK